MTAKDRIVRDEEADGIVGLKRTQRHVLEKKQLFPQRRKLSPLGRATGYLLSELEAWVSSRPVITATPAISIGSGKSGPGRGNKKQPVVTA